MRVYLTGGSGFVGKNLIPYLEKNRYEIGLLERNELQSSLMHFRENFDAIVHLAGKAHDIQHTSDPDEYYKVNFELTKKLYDEFLKSDMKKFIFVSSVKACADTVSDILTEKNIPNPKTDYGKSKLLAEEYIQQQDLPNGKSYYILRPCMIHGIGNKGNLNLLFKFVNMGIPYPLAAFENKRSFLSVENLCFVVNALLEADISSGVYNVADDEPLSTTEVVKILAKESNRKAKIWKFSPAIIKLLASVGDKIGLPLNNERLKKLTESYVVSNQKIKESMKKELPLSSIEGLMRTASSFK